MWHVNAGEKQTQASTGSKLSSATVTDAVDASAVLLKWAESHRDAWPVDNVRNRALRATLARSTRTLSAARELLRGSYGPQALALSRGLFEDMVVSHWMVHCRTQPWVERRLRNQHDYSRLVWHEVMRKHQGPSYEGFDRSERRRIGRRRLRLEQLFGKGAEQSWWARDIELRKDRKPGQRRYRTTNRRNLADLVNELESHPKLQQRWGPSLDEQGRETGQSMLRWAYDVPQRVNNQFVMHHTAHALASVTDERAGQVAFIDAADNEWLPQAGIFLCWTFMQLLALMVDHGAPQLADDLRKACTRPFALAFREVSDEQHRWARKHRNEPCPCGSGLKSKHCHAQ